MAPALSFLIVPTFKERAQIERLLYCLRNTQGSHIQIVIVNANPGDDTSRYLESLHNPRIFELHGHSGLYWSGLVNLGLSYVMRCPEEKEFVIILNADIEFEGDVVGMLIAKARSKPNSQLAAVTAGGRRVISSGIRVISWLLTLNRHPLAGEFPEEVAGDALIPVDFLPTRCTLIPYRAVAVAGLVAEKQLPHYGADNEYTNRLRRLGFQPYIYTGVQVKVDTKHTGTDVFHLPLSLGSRLRCLFTIRSTANPIYRLQFVKLVYPRYAWPSAMLLYLLRTSLEVFLGGARIKSLFPTKGRGYSGS